MADIGDDLAGMYGLSYQKIIETDIFTLIGAGNMPEKDKKELEAKIFDTIRNRVTARINDVFTDEEAENWQKLPSQEEKEKFLEKKGLNIDKMMVEEALIYKIELINLSKPLRDALKKK
jgi:hypothetical protein